MITLYALIVALIVAGVVGDYIVVRAAARWRNNQ